MDTCVGTVHCPKHYQNHRRRIYIESKAKVVVDFGGKMAAH